ncbi:MAG: DUF4405 domain-containing protein [bacterium]|nr:DUF4405 domain-containing protein [bacterium]
MSANRKFKTKSFASFTIAWIFLVLTVTGIIIYFTPAGRIAHWTNWTFWGLTKDEWQGVHIVFSALFIIFMVFHLFFNWKVFMSYLKSRASEGIRLKKELALATLITIVFMLVTLTKWQPVWILMDWREDLKQGDQIMESPPPIPHTEDMTISEIAELINMPEDEIIETINEKGYEIEDSDVTLSVIAEKNNTTPEKLYSEIVGEEFPQLVPGRGGGGEGLGRRSTKERSEILEEEHGTGSIDIGGNPGYGRKSVKELCAEAGITLEQGIENLKSHGVKARANDRIRNIATKNNLRPSDVARYLEKK